MAGLLSRNEKDNVFDAINGSYGTPERYSGFLNALEPTDRNLFYQLQDYELLTTESEETTLWDGREWRIHYWKFKSKRLGEVAKKKVDEVIDPYAGLYEEVPVDIWREQAGFEHDDDEPLF